MNCPRCRGLMVTEEFYDLRSDTEQSELLGWHCLLCGEVVDPVITTNRGRSGSGHGTSAQVAQQEFAGLGEEGSDVIGGSAARTMNRIGGIRMSKLLSVNVGYPRDIRWKGRTITTGIFKEPVEGRVAVRTFNLDGDRQADLSVHGGRDKAVYAYPSEHYAFWRKEFPGRMLPWGMFGENFTTEGLLEHDVSIGDRFRIGSAIVQVTQPRMPCYKLGAKFGRQDILRRFLASGRTGWYFAVVEEGAIGAGDRIELISRHENSLSVAELIGLYRGDTDAPRLLERAVRSEALPQDWRDYLAGRLGTVDSRRS